MVNGDSDRTASVWGAGLALDFNDQGEGGIKKAYSGPAKGLVVKLSGTLSGQELQFSYKQSDSDNCAPYTSATTLGTFVLPFTSVTCPTWTCYAPGCKSAGASPFALDIFVVGGDVAGPFDICLESVTPIL
jgi:hypothetical protein